MATTATTLENEVFLGAGASATLIPESTFYIGASISTGTTPATHGGIANAQVPCTPLVLVPGLYAGCTLRCTFGGIQHHLVIKDNTDAQIYLGESTAATITDVSILPYGAPCPAPAHNKSYSGTETSLLADNWLGLVNTFTPPSVAPEIAQMNLALGGTRNFTYQYKKAETVSGASLDISLNNGSWLYYALGKISTVAHSVGADAESNTTGFATKAGGDSREFVRLISGTEFPPSSATVSNGVLTGAAQTHAGYKQLGTGDITYTFTEKNGGELPSFALEVTYEKSDLADGSYFVGSRGSGTDETTASDPTVDVYSRIVTGCQVNTMTLNFEEGMEVKTSLDLVSKGMLDAPLGYVPRNNQRDNDSLLNRRGDPHDRPYLFSDGEITLFSSTFARIKSGSLTITNNLTPQRFMGNYNKSVISTHIPGQRLYDFNFTMLITDTKVWDELRKEGEVLTGDGQIKLKFSKTTDDSTLNENDYIELDFRDFIVSTVDIPFPEDKGPLEVAVTMSARTLQSAKYQGRWVIINQDN